MSTQQTNPKDEALIIRGSKTRNDALAAIAAKLNLTLDALVMSRLDPDEICDEYGLDRDFLDEILINAEE